MSDEERIHRLERWMASVNCDLDLTAAIGNILLRFDQVEDRITTLYELRESDNEEMTSWVRSISNSLDKLWERVYAIEEHLGLDPLVE